MLHIILNRIFCKENKNLEKTHVALLFCDLEERKNSSMFITIKCCKAFGYIFKCMDCFINTFSIHFKIKRFGKQEHFKQIK